MPVSETTFTRPKRKKYQHYGKYINADSKRCDQCNSKQYKEK